VPLPSPLQAYAKAPGIRAHARTFRQLEKELARIGASLPKFELVEKMARRTGLRGLFTLERADAADWWLVVECQVETRPLRVIAPFRRGLTLPYSLEMGLKARLEFSGSQRRNLLLKARWEMLPATAASRELGSRLDQLTFLPKIRWRHDSGGIPILLKEGARLAPAPTNETWPSTWTVFSGAQGFIFNVGPRIAKYVAAAHPLELFLEQWKPTPAPQAAPRRDAPTRPGQTAEPRPGPPPGGLELPDQKDLEALLGGKGPPR
jgi:hypothetical protein